MFHSHFVSFSHPLIDDSHLRNADGTLRKALRMRSQGVIM